MHENSYATTRRKVLQRGSIITGALVLGGIAGTQAASADIGDGRLLDLHLNNVNYDRDKGDIVAGHVHDASTYDNDGEWWNTDVNPVVKDGAVGNAYAFDGVEDYLWVPHADSLSPTSSITVATWVKTTDYGPGKVLIDKDRRSDGKPGYFIAIDRGTDQKYPRFLWEDTNGTRHSVESSESVSDGNWHHLAATYDGSAMRFYVDGAETGTNEVAFTGKATTAPLELMRDTDYPVGGTTYTEGWLDEVRVYNRALDSTEVNELVAMRDQ